MSSSDFSNNINNWRVLEEHSWSDHKMIHMTFDATQPCYTWKRKLGEIDLEVYREKIKEQAEKWELNGPYSCLDLELASRKWTAIIFEILDELAPLVKVKIKTSINIWWNESLQLLKNKCDHLHKEATSHNSTNLWGNSELQGKHILRKHAKLGEIRGGAFAKKQTLRN
jgi:hypothetical protein